MNKVAYYFFSVVAGLLLTVVTVPYALAEEPKPAEYLISPGDVLDISVWGEEELKRSVLVRADSGISFPLAGDLPTKGRTIAQLQEDIATRLKKYIPDPVVTVAVQEHKGNVIYVIGKVNKPGEYTISRVIDVMQAISLAGGLSPFADDNDIKIMRRKDGKIEIFDFDYSEVIDGENLSQNIMLEAGDTVMVPQ